MPKNIPKFALVSILRGPNIAEAVNLSGKTFAETTLFHKPCVCEYHRKDESLPVIDTLPFLKKHLFQNHDEKYEFFNLL